MSTLPDIAAATVAEHAMFSPGGPVVAMVSGGADSVALLRWLASSKATGTLSVLHVNHQLRGEAADSDAAFVERLCGELGVPGRVATAHTFDDRAETMVMRLAQGTGASGLVSPPYRRGRIVRPLLDCTRADVTGYLTGIGQAWREDATNLAYLPSARPRARGHGPGPARDQPEIRRHARAHATSDVRRGRSARRRGGGRGGRARRSPWRRAEDRPCSIGASASASLELALKGTTLADLAARQRELDARAAAMYYI